MAEVLVRRGVPDTKETEDVDIGLIWDDVLNQIVGFYGHNNTEDQVTLKVGVGATVRSIQIPAFTSVRNRVNLPTGQRIAMRRATGSDHPWQQQRGWVPSFTSITVEREFTKPRGGSPSILSAAYTEFFSSATTTHNVPMPATVDPNDGLLVGFFIDTASDAWATGFSVITDATNTDRGFTFGKVAVGNEDGTNVNFLTTSASFAIAHVYRIDAGTWGECVAAFEGATATGSSATPDPPSITPSWGSQDITVVAFGMKTTGTVTSAPTNYTDLINGSGGDNMGSARRSLTTTTEDPGTFGGSTSSAWTGHTVAIAPEDADLTSGGKPYFVGAGTSFTGTGAATGVLPGGLLTNDLLLWLMETEGEDTNAETLPDSWLAIDGSGGSVASATDSATDRTRLTIGYIVYDSGSPPDLTPGVDPGDHHVGIILAFRNVDTTTPINAQQSSSDSSNDTAMSVTGVNSTVDDALVVQVESNGDDNAVGGPVSPIAVANANLAAPAVRHAGSGGTTSGSDGSISAWFGGLAAQGATGALTGTLQASEESASWTIVLTPAPSGGAVVELAGSIAGTSAVTADLDAIDQLASTVAGTSTVAAALTQVYNLSATADGTSSVTGDLDAVVPLAATADGTSTVTGDIDATDNLLGLIDGTSTVAANLIQLQPLASSIAGTSTVTVDLDQLVELDTSASGSTRIGRKETVLNPVALQLSKGRALGYAPAFGRGFIATPRVEYITHLDVIADLRATADGTSTVIGALAGAAVVVELEGDSDGTSAVTASLTQIHDLNSDALGEGSVSGNGEQDHQLLGAINGVGTVAPLLTQIQELVSQVDGVATVTAALQQTHALASSIVGTGTVTAALTQIHELQTSVSGEASVTGALAGVQNLAGTSDGVATVLGNLIQIHRLVSSVDGTGSVTGALTQIHSLNAETDGVGAVNGEIAPNAFVGTINGVGSVTAELDVTDNLASSISGVATVTADLDAIDQLATTSDGTSTVTANLSVATELVASSDGVATVTGALTQIHALSSTVTGTGTVSGDPDTTADIESTIAGVGSVTGDLDAIDQLLAQVDGIAIVAAELDVTGATSGNSDGVATVTAQLTVITFIQGEITGAATVTATLSSIGPITFATVSLSDAGVGRNTLSSALVNSATLSEIEITGSELTSAGVGTTTPSDQGDGDVSLSSIG